MGEVRLICPGCEAEYRLPETAIPAAGREVECTACGRVWQASREGVPARPSPAGATPPDFDPAPGAQRQDIAPPPAEPPSRRLSPSVLSILREEVEHERRARMAEDHVFAPPAGSPQGAPPADAPRAPIISSEVDWPATTVTASDPAAPVRAPILPVTPQAPSQSPALAQAQAQTPAPAPAPALPPAAPRILAEDDRAQPREATSAEARTMPLPSVAPARAQPAAAPIPLKGAPSGRGYRMGLGLAAMVAAAGLALYLLAPGLSGTGPVAEGLTEFRAFVDQGRGWLQMMLRPA